jgi:glycoprotein endo-alpha-1,2-mannosidase
MVLGLLVKQAHMESLLRGGFDGYYNYFASDGFEYGTCLLCPLVCSLSSSYTHTYSHTVLSHTLTTFTYLGSTWKNFRTIAAFARTHSLLYVPCIGPGYVDTAVRPWNAANTKSRGDEGAYYRSAFSHMAQATHSDSDASAVVGITSFNEVCVVMMECCV